MTSSKKYSSTNDTPLIRHPASTHRGIHSLDPAVGTRGMTPNGTGLLLINIGTPDAPTPKSVRRYLKEFLSDPRVIDLPAPLRWILVNLFILPFRPKNSAKLYHQIWFEQGSPLRVYSELLQRELNDYLQGAYPIAVAMRYGNPSIENGIDGLLKKGCQKIIVLPLFPQYSSAASGSAIQKTLQIISSRALVPNLEVHSHFYAHPDFIHAYTALIAEIHTRDDFVLFSYHGIPVRQIENNACSDSHCDRARECPSIKTHLNNGCYRSQCYETSHLLAQKLGLNSNQYTTSFQSRLGKTPWISPYTDLILPELIQQGKKNLVIACPSFVTDCLETLEEINIRARSQWLALGGESFKLVPCLNANPQWIKALANIMKLDYAGVTNEEICTSVK